MTGPGRFRPGLLLAVLALLAAMVAVVGTPLAPARAATSVPMTSVYDQSVYGDLLELGNSAVTCPSGNASCVSGAGSYTTSNNGFAMVYADVDGDATTYNSSQATFTLPAGTSVAYARLNWSGMSVTGSCTNGVMHAGSAWTDPVKLKRPRFDAASF